MGSAPARALHPLRDFDSKKIESTLDLRERECAQPEPRRPQSLITFRKDVVLGVNRLKLCAKTKTKSQRRLGARLVSAASNASVMARSCKARPRSSSERMTGAALL